MSPDPPGSERFEEIEERLDRLAAREAERGKIKDRDYYKIRHLIFDQRTVRSLVRLFNAGVIRDFNWVVSAGKESLVMSGEGARGEVAIKVYRIDTADFSRYLDYMIGDPRFRPPRGKTKLVMAWARKEFQNLGRMREADARVPEPLGLAGNVLVMEFIGEGGFPAPLLRQVTDLPDPRRTMELILEDVGRIVRGANLVHGDLSEYNIMYWKDLPWIIDCSQSVLLAHPMARELLERDLRVITRFFRRRYGLATPDPERLAEDLMEG